MEASEAPLSKKYVPTVDYIIIIKNKNPHLAKCVSFKTLKYLY